MKPNCDRLDKWLWGVRLFKTRILAGDACSSGAVLVNDREAKPGPVVHAGETITVRQGQITRTLRVKDCPRSRVGAKLVADYYEDLTPASEFEKLKPREEAGSPTVLRSHGRPTKRDRRQLEQLFDE